jgi:hypothetical protein
MSDRKALAREIAARSKPRFIEIPKEPKTKDTPNLPRDLKVRARAIAKATPPRFIAVERERYDGTMRAKRGGLTADEYRRLLIEKSRCE